MLHMIGNIDHCHTCNLLNNLDLKYIWRSKPYDQYDNIVMVDSPCSFYKMWYKCFRNILCQLCNDCHFYSLFGIHHWDRFPYFHTHDRLYIFPHREKLTCVMRIIWQIISYNLFIIGVLQEFLRIPKNFSYHLLLPKRKIDFCQQTKYLTCDIKKTKSRIRQFTNLKCWKMSFKAFKMKKQGSKYFLN